MEDVEQLRGACSTRSSTGLRNRALLAVLFRSGLRISEALALKPKDLDLRVPHGSVRVLHGKGDRSRVAPLPPDAVAAVAHWLERRRHLAGITGRHVVFCRLPGKRPRALDDLRMDSSYVRHLCKRLAAKAGVERRVHPHGFRHGWAASQAKAGTPMNAIQQLLGHSSLATTSTYLNRIAPAAAVAAAIANSTADAVAP